MRRNAIIFLFTCLIFFTACKGNTNTNTNTSPAPAPAANPDIKDTDGFTPLMNAAKNGDMDGAQRAIANGANVNAANDTGISALFIAAGLGNSELTKLLLDKGANVNAKTNGGFTPLMQAALTGQIETAKLLLNAGADVTATDIAKKNAVDYAPDAKKKEFSALLKISPANPSPMKVLNEKPPANPTKKK